MVKHMKSIRPQDVRVGEFFLLSDFLYSHEAVRDGIPNLPLAFDGDEVAGMRGLCQHILDPVVKQFGALSITYAYCSENYWWEKYGDRYVGNDLHSYRLNRGGVGGAADILVHSQKDNPCQVIYWIRDNCEFDRLILYKAPRPIICVAWTSVNPRYHAKEWRVVEGKTKYVDVL